MAILDDPEWLLKYIRHSFITSDDTGMCEMVIQDNDLMTLDEHRKHIRQQQQAKFDEKLSRKGLPETFGKSTPTGSPQRSLQHSTTSSTYSYSGSSVEEVSSLAPSPDILSGWDFGVRRRSNTAQKLERIRKERQNRIKVNSIPWRKRQAKLTEEQITKMFVKKDLRKDIDTGQRRLTVDNEDRPGSLESSPSNSRTISSTTTVKRNSESPAKHVVHYGFQVEDIKESFSQLKVSENGTSALTNHFGEEVGGVCNHEENRTELRTEKCKGGCPHPRSKNDISALSQMLLQSSEQYNNPFREYSKFNAQGHEGTGTANIKKINIYIWPYGSDRPKFSNKIAVLSSGAKVQDVIGLTCWQYTNENQEPPLQSKSVQRYSLHIADDDGTVDRDFPALEPSEPFSKFGFNTLALVEKPPYQSGTNGEDGGKQSVFVKVNDHAGFSLIKVEDLSITMGEILRKTIKRRKGQSYPGRYKLEYEDKPGIAVNEEQTLESTGVMEFHLVREHSTRTRTVTNTYDGNPQQLSDKFLGPQDGEYRFPPMPRSQTLPSPGDNTFVFVPAMEYQTFRLYQLHKLRSSTPVILGVGPSQVDVEPANRRESRSKINQLFSPRVKSLAIRVKMLAYCAIQESKNNTTSTSLSASPSSSSGGNSFSSSGVSASFATFDAQSTSRSTAEKMVLKLYYRQSENHPDFKHLTLEGPGDEVQDAFERVKKVMDLGGNTKLKAEFEAIKLGIPHSTTSSSNNTVTRSRKGSLFR